MVDVPHRLAESSFVQVDGEGSYRRPMGQTAACHFCSVQWHNRNTVGAVLQNAVDVTENNHRWRLAAALLVFLGHILVLRGDRLFLDIQAKPGELPCQQHDSFTSPERESQS